MIICPVTGKKRYTDYCHNLKTMKIDPHYQKHDDIHYVCSAHYIQIDDIELYCINQEGNFIEEKEMEI
jgi:hypothetical protein